MDSLFTRLKENNIVKPTQRLNSIIVYVKNLVITNIPDEHSLEITGSNWDYQLDRMEFIGDKNKFGDLLEDQKFSYNSWSQYA